MSTSLAMITKARTLLSEHLKKDDYKKLESSKRVPELLPYFENNERYRELVSNLHNKDIHRHELEEHIRLIIPREYRKLKKFGHDIKVDPVLLSIERDLIVNKLYSLQYDVPFSLNRSHIELSDLIVCDMQSLRDAKTHEEVLKLFRKSIYYDFLKNHTEIKTFWEIEVGIRIFEFDYIMKHTSKKDEDLRNLVSRTFLYDAFNILLNLSKYDKESANTVVNLLPSKIYNVNRDELKNWVAGGSYEEKVMVYLDSPPALNTLELSLLYQKYKMCSKTLRFSQNSSAILYAYIELVRIETKIIITIIESTRYQVETLHLFDLIDVGGD